jgi:hypothetical protein
MQRTPSMCAPNMPCHDGAVPAPRGVTESDDGLDDWAPRWRARRIPEKFLPTSWPDQHRVLLGPERLHRVCSSRSTRGEPAREKRDTKQNR